MLEASSEDLESPRLLQRWLQVKLVKCPWEEVEAGSVHLLHPKNLSATIAWQTRPCLLHVICRQTHLGAATLVGRYLSQCSCELLVEACGKPSSDSR